MRGKRVREVAALVLGLGGVGVGLGAIGWAVFGGLSAGFGWGGALTGMLLFVAAGLCAPEVEAAPLAKGEDQDQREKDSGGGGGCGGGCGSGCGGCGGCGG